MIGPILPSISKRTPPHMHRPVSIIDLAFLCAARLVRFAHINSAARGRLARSKNAGSIRSLREGIILGGARAEIVRTSPAMAQDRRRAGQPRRNARFRSAVLF